MNNFRTATQCVIMMLAIGTMIGCQKSGPPLGNVQGIIRVDGEPLQNAQVMFIPDQEGRFSTGSTDDAGRYLLMFTAGRSGALIGEHHVKITSATSEMVNLETNSVTQAARQEILPEKYHSATELVAVVKKGSNDIDFDLTSH